MHYDSYVGIDCGLHGAAARISSNGIEIQDTPNICTIVKKKDKKLRRYSYDLDALVEVFSPLITPTTFVAIEHIHSSPQMGVTSAFNMGVGYGIWQGVLATLGVPYVSVDPQKWKKHHDLIGTEKHASMDKALELYPEAPITLRKHNDRADALLIARWLSDLRSEVCKETCP